MANGDISLLEDHQSKTHDSSSNYSIFDSELAIFMREHQFVEIE